MPLALSGVINENVMYILGRMSRKGLNNYSMYLVSQALIIWGLTATTLQSQILKGPVQRKACLYFHSSSEVWVFNITVVSNHIRLKLGVCFCQPRCNFFFSSFLVLKTLFKSVQLFIIWRSAKLGGGRRGDFKFFR